MLLTYAIYLGTPVLCGLFASKAARREAKGYVWAIIWLLTLVAGLRGYSVGVDTANYVYKYQLIADGHMRYAYGFEYTFKLICYALSWISDDGTFFLLLMALLTNGLIVLRFWDYREVSSFPWMVVCYYLLLYHMTLNGVRQFCAVAIVFYSTRYLDRRKIGHFLVGIGIAFLFHQSAIIGLAFLFEKMLHWRELSLRQKGFFLLSLAVSPVAVVYLLKIVGRYDRYFSARSVSLGIMIPAKLALFVLALLFVWQIYRRCSRQSLELEQEPGEERLIPGICLFYAIGLGLTGLGYVFSHMERIGWYFYLYEGVFYGVARKDSDLRSRVLLGAGCLFLVVYGFVFSTLGNGQGTMPYEFFWQG